MTSRCSWWKFFFLILGFWAQYWSKRPCRCCHQPHVWRWKWTELLDQVRWCVTCHTIGRSSPFGRWFCYAIRICRKSGAGAHREKNYGNSYILRKTNDGTSLLPNCKEFFFISGLMGHSSVWVTTAQGSCTLGHLVGTWAQAKFVAGNTNVTARSAKLGTEKSLGLFSPGLKDKPGMASI